MVVSSLAPTDGLTAKASMLHRATSDVTAPLRLYLFGPMEARTASGASVLPIGRKTRALLAILAVCMPRPISRARLADLLWSRRHTDQARASLRQELHRLLEALQPVGVDVLEITREQLTLRPDLVWIDVREVSLATVASPASLALVSGELLEEFEDIDPALDDWLSDERKQLRERARSVAETVLCEQVDSDVAMASAQQLLTIDRYHEGAWRAIMHGYAVRGESGKAIQAYEQCREVLAGKLQASPSIDTQRLAEDIRAGNKSVSNAGRNEQSRRPDARVEGVRVSVMPLQILTPGTVEQVASVSLGQELTNALARFRWLTLYPSSSLTRVGEQGAVTQLAKGLDFVVEGSIQRIDDRVIIAMWLLDLQSNARIVWNSRCDYGRDELLAAQDRIAGAAASAIDAEISRIEGLRAVQSNVVEETAYNLVRRAVPLILSLGHDENKAAGEFLSRAREIEPTSAESYSWTAYWQMVSISQGWAERSPSLLAEVGAYAERAITLDTQDARGLTIAGHVRAYLHRRPEEAIDLHLRALDFNPNLAIAWGLSACAHVYLGQLETARQQFGNYERLAAMDSDLLFGNSGVILLKILDGDYPGAVAIGRRLTEVKPRFTEGLKHYLVALGLSGQDCYSAAILGRVLAIEPSFSVQVFLAANPFKLSTDRDLYAKGLRLAGVPEGKCRKG